MAMAQNSTLKGVVVDSANQPVIGAFVVEQGTNNGTMTGVDGDFAITTRRSLGFPVRMHVPAPRAASGIWSSNGMHRMLVS